MNIDQSKLLIETGNITRAVIMAAPMVAGKWVVEFHRVGEETVPLQPDSGFTQIDIFFRLRGYTCQPVHETSGDSIGWLRGRFLW